MSVPNITADQIPRWMADNDHRGRIVELRELCKQWVHTDQVHRAAMVAAAPRRHRWWHRFTRRRHDLTRIAAAAIGGGGTTWAAASHKSAGPALRAAR